MSSVSALQEAISRKLAAGTPLTGADAERLFETPDLIAVGVLADEARQRINGDDVTFVRVLDVPAHGPIPAIPPDTGEVRIVGAEPGAPATLDRIRQVASAAGTVPVSACALHELTGEFAARMRDAGAALVAEAAVDRLAGRVPLDAVLDAGLGIARWTVQSYLPLPPVEVFELVRSLGHVSPFAPLPRAIDPAAPTTGYDDVKLVSVARLFLDRVRTISVDWSLYGPKLSQVALTFGADDIDGVPADAQSANLLGPRRSTVEEVRRNVRTAGRTPVARDGAFRVVGR